MRIRVDEDLCQGHGVCANEAPHVFRVEGDGCVQVLVPEPPPEQHDRVRAAVRHCPTFALSIED